MKVADAVKDMGCTAVHRGLQPLQLRNLCAAFQVSGMTRKTKEAGTETEPHWVDDRRPDIERLIKHSNFAILVMSF